MAITPNYYETLYLTRPDLKEEDLAKIQEKLLDSISNNEGEIVKAEKWAERELPYDIQDHKRGIYYILVFKAMPDSSKEVEKHLQFYRTDVLRFMTLKITEEAANKHKKSKEEKAPKAESVAEAEAAVAPVAEAEAAVAPEVESQPVTAPEVVAEPAPAVVEQAEEVEVEEAAAETTEVITSAQEEGGTQ